MHKAILSEFIRNGRLGPLVLGMSQREVRQILGEPDAHSDPHPRTAVWKYGALQVSFQDSVLDMINLHFAILPAQLPETLEVEGYFPHQGASLEEVKTYLAQEQIEFDVNKLLTFDDQLGLDVAGGATLVFDTLADGLYSVACSSQ